MVQFNILKDSTDVDMSNHLLEHMQNNKDPYE